MIILTPVRARDKEDVLLREKIIRENVGNNYPFGFEIKLFGGAKGDINDSEIIKENLKPYSDDPDFFLALHSPLGKRDVISEETDLTAKEGLALLEKLLTLAQDINAKLVNLHTERIFSASEFAGKKFKIEEKKALQEKVKRGVIEVKGKVGYKGKITFENVPHTLMGDNPFFRPVGKRVFDPLILTAEDLSIFAEKEESMGVCIDTAHYAATRMEIGQTEKHKLIGLPDEDIIPQPSLIELAERLKDKLFYVHLCDFRPISEEDGILVEQGVVPGEGDYGEELKQFAKYIKEKEIPLLLEVNDRDYKVLEETKRSIRWMINNN